MSSAFRSTDEEKRGTARYLSTKTDNENKQNMAFYSFHYPGYQRFFLACDEELSPGVGRRPTCVRPKAEETSGEAARKAAGHL